LYLTTDASCQQGRQIVEDSDVLNAKELRYVPEYVALVYLLQLIVSLCYRWGSDNSRIGAPHGTLLKRAQEVSTIQALSLGNVAPARRHSFDPACCNIAK
jgi:hypothetical protein